MYNKPSKIILQTLKYNNLFNKLKIIENNIQPFTLKVNQQIFLNLVILSCVEKNYLKNTWNCIFPAYLKGHSK